MKFWIVGVLILSFSASFKTALANEGMWQPHQLADIKEQLVAAGLELNPEDMSDLSKFPMNAIISLGGCTASFVSDQGLVVTNHHCAYRSIQHNSSESNNLLANGFVAKTKQEELAAAPGSRVYITESLTDVTDKVTGDISSDLTGNDYYLAIEKNRKALVAQCEVNKDYRCSVSSFHGGASYVLIKLLTIRDVRLAYAPPSSIGKFGGDTDNWQWPRQTGDWAFYRAYVGKDGKPADFSEDNVPYKNKAFLKVKASGVDEGDYVMVLGYPGRTNRYRTAVEVENTFTWTYPTAKVYREEYIDVIKQNSAPNSDERIKYASTIAGLANYAKNYGSMVKSYKKGDMLARKQQLETDLATWLSKDASMNKLYGDSLRTLNKLVVQSDQNKERDLLMGYLGRTTMMSVSKRLLRLAHEQGKPDIEREVGYQERNLKRFEQSMASVNSRYVADIDKAIVLHFLAKYIDLPAEQRVATFDKFFAIQGKDLSKAKVKIDRMYAATKLGNEDTRLAMMKMSEKELRGSSDPFIQFAVSQFDYNMAEEKRDKALAGQLQRVRPDYMKALIAFKKSRKEAVYADANSTLRITYGNVKGYSPQDGLTATPFTTTEGMLAKYIPGDDEFDLPAKLRQAILDKRYGSYVDETMGSVPVNYLSTLDITGGNSGSPTLNSKGEFVGLVFDGVYESIIGDWDYDPVYNRAIHVSSPFMLWVMDEVDGAQNLINEMHIVE
ncbi:S46 family peptidase [Aliiglaciecola sp.]|nr:S46 family peptidase [Aliiglaciecola sp.]